MNGDRRIEIGREGCKAITIFEVSGFDVQVDGDRLDSGDVTLWLVISSQAMAIKAHFGIS